jgi:dTDP-4-dehydrorhamnose 3,5-epimerase
MLIEIFFTGSAFVINKKETNVEDSFVFDFKRNHDNRGYFEEIFNPNYNLQKPEQINHSFSYKGVLRGIHVSPYYKLVTCIRGKIFDVCVDLRKDSKSYLKSFSVILQQGDNKQFLIPAFCGHAFLALEDSDIIYFQGGVFNEHLDLNVIWSDKIIDIKWPEMNYIISDKDLNSKSLQDQDFFIK